MNRLKNLLILCLLIVKVDLEIIATNEVCDKNCLEEILFAANKEDNQTKSDKLTNHTFPNDVLISDSHNENLVQSVDSELIQSSFLHDFDSKTDNIEIAENEKGEKKNYKGILKCSNQNHNFA